MSSDRPIFVVGCPRSGTTLLQVILHAHSHIAIPPENRFVMPAYHRRARFGDLRQRENRAKVARYITRRQTTRFDDLGLDPKDVHRRILDAPPTIGSLLGVVLQAYAEAHGKPRWGDKRPSYIEELPVILGLFPDAQIVHVIRDGRDCLSSILRMPWFRGTVHDAIREWVVAIDEGARARARLRPDQYLELRYEDLIGDTRRTLEGLCAFLGEDLDEAMLAHEQVARVAVPERKHWHAGTHQSINPGAIERWQHDLTPADLNLFELVAARRLREHGYELSRGRRPITHPIRVAAYLWRRLRWRAFRLRRRTRHARTNRGYHDPVAARITRLERRLAGLESR